MRNAPLLSDLELVILGFLRERPRSGYDIRKALSSASVSDSPGTVYPALHRLRNTVRLLRSTGAPRGRGGARGPRRVLMARRGHQNNVSFADGNLLG